MKTLIKISALIIFLVAAPAAIPQSKSVPIDKLGAYIGRWKSSGESYDTAYSKAQKLSAETICQWSVNHGYMICDQTVNTPDGLRNDLSIYTYDEKDQTFAFFGISRDSTRARTPKLTIEGNLWTYSNEFDEGPKHIRFRTVNEFTSANSITFHTEYSEDGVHWTATGKGSVWRVQ